MGTSSQFPEETMRCQRLKVFLEGLWQPGKHILCCIWNSLLRCRKWEIREEQRRKRAEGKWVGLALGIIFTPVQTEPTVG